MSNYDWSTAYNDICKEIEVLDIRKDELSGELKLIERKMAAGPRTKLVASYSGMPNGSGADTPLPQMWQMVNDIRSVIEDIDDVLDLKQEAKKRMETKIGEMSSIERQVAYKRDIERKSLEQISAEMSYSYNWIAKISSRVKRIRPTG